MIQIEYKDKGFYNLPTSWSEVTIEQFQAIDRLEIEAEVEKSVAFISILTGIALDDLLDLPITEFNKIESHISFVNVDKKEKIKLTFEIEGVKYGYRKSLEDMKTSEYIDFDTIITSDTVIDNIHVLMAILYRPIITSNGSNYSIEQYSSETLNNRATLFKKHLTVDIMLSAMLFLQAHVKISSEHILDYLKKSKKQKMTMSKKHKVLTFHNDGGGLFHYTKWLNRILGFKMHG